MEFTFQDFRKDYYLKLDMCNALKSVEDNIHIIDEGNTCIIFIDAYDIMSFVFPPGLLFNDPHAPMNKFIYEEIFEEVQPEDPIKFSMTPASCLELFYILDKNAFNVFKRIPLKHHEIEKIRSIKNEEELKAILQPYRNDLIITKSLLDESGKSELNHIDKLLKLMSQNKMFNSNEIFNFSKGDIFEYDAYSASLVDSNGARIKLSRSRKEYKIYFPKYKVEELSALDLGLEDFSIEIDISSMRTTTFLNRSKDKIYRYITNGFNFLIVFADTWKGKKKDLPISNAYFAFFLSRFLHAFKTSKEAEKEIYRITKCYNEYFREIEKIKQENEDFLKYFYRPKENGRVKNKIIETGKRLDILNEYLSNFCGIVHLNSKRRKLRKIEISTSSTGITDMEVFEYARDEEKMKALGEKLRKFSTESLRSLINLDEVSRFYFPPDEVTSNLILRTKGYSYNDF